MSKRSRQYFEAFNQLREEQNVYSPKQKRRKLNNNNNDSLSQSSSNENNSNTKSDTTRRVTKIMNAISLKPPSPNSNKYKNKNVSNTFDGASMDKTTKVFDGNVFFIANIGTKNKQSGRRNIWSDLNKNRVKLFNHIIPKNGGQIIENMEEFDDKNNNNLIIIVSANIKRQDFDELFDENMQKNKRFKFVTPDFITSCLKYQNKLSLKQFKPQCLTQKQKINNTVIMDTEKKDIIISDKKKDIKSEQSGNWLDRNKDKFACQIENDGQKVNYNSNITEIFDEMERIYNCLGDKWREYGYKKANGFIKKYPKKIKTENDIKQLIKMKGFSKKLGDKVLEIINTGKLRKLNELQSMPQIKTIKLFSNIFGVGAITAQKWYNLGLRRLDDLKNDKFNIKLQERQQIGIKYYDDLLIKIARSEVREIEKFVHSEINKLCPGCKCVTCGSYRRGKLQSGDIDILVTHSDITKINGLIHKIIDRLHEIGFLLDDLSMPSTKDDDHDTYMGICKLLNNEYKYYRHIDIKVYKPSHFAFAVLYFTGSDHFNRSMRYYAKQKGYTLSDTQLAPTIRISNDKIFTFKEKAIKCKTEQDIFNALDLKYIKPTDRNTYENFGYHTNQNYNKNTNNNNNDNNNNNNNTNNCSNTP